MSDQTSSQPSAPQPSAPQADEIEGYRTLEVIGRGGMGIVWRAEQLATRREVALKVLAGASFASPAAARRFRREVELAAQLEHPNIARIYDSGLHHGVCWYAMQLVDGLSLDDFVHRHQLDDRTCVELVGLVCQAVQYAHERGIVHRDLKPANVLVRADGAPFVLDFGLARSLEAGQESVQLSMTGDIAGTPAYMSPEQAAGERHRVDTRSDVYSLGVILYELLTGDVPHDRDGTPVAVVLRVATEEPRRPRAVRPDLDRDLEALLLKALARDPAERYANAGEMAADIQRYLAGEPLAARVPTTAYFLRKRLQRHWLAVAVAAVVLLLLLIVGLGSWLLARHSGSAPPAVAVAPVAATQPGQADLYERYVNRVQTAQRQLVDNAYGQARASIAEAPKSLRAWEWGRLALLTSLESDVLDTGTPLWGLTVGPKEQFLVTTDRDGGMKLWDLPQRKLLRTIEAVGEKEWRGKVCITSDGHWLAWTDGRGSAYAERVRTGAGRRQLGADLGAQIHLAAHPSQPLVAVVCGDPRPDRMQRNRVLLIRPDTGEQIRVLGLATATGTQCLQGASFSGDGRRFAACYYPDHWWIWDVDSGQLVADQPVKDAYIATVALSPDGALIAAGGNAKVLRVWRGDTGEQVAEFATAGNTEALAFAPDGNRLAFTAFRRPPEVRDIATGELLRTLGGHSDSVTGVLWLEGGRQLATASLDHSVRFWDWQKCRAEFILAAGRTVTNAAYRPDGRALATVDETGLIRLWDPLTGALIRTFGSGQANGGHENRVAWAPDGSWLAATWAGSRKNRVAVWKPATGSLEQTLDDQQAMVTGVAAGPRGEYLAACSANGQVNVWQAGKWRLLYTLSHPGAASVAFSPNGQWLATTGTDKTARLWRLPDGTAGPVLAGHESNVTAAAFSPDSCCLATVSIDKHAILWQVADGTKVRTFEGHVGMLWYVTFSPDGKRLLTCSDDGTARLWDTATGRELYTIQDEPGVHFSAAVFSPDGRQIAITTATGKARILLARDWRREVGGR